MQASAPGKVVLCGEYAVLDGAPAIAMAVDCRATVVVETGGQATLRCVGLGGRADRSLLDCVLNVLGGSDADAGSLVLDTSAFADAASGRKLGIGSSAALCVALVQALSPNLDKRQVMSNAAAAHCDFQGGLGSGIDVVTSAIGGLVLYRRDQANASSLRWPDGLHYVLLWSGVPASTRERIARLDNAGQHASRTALSAAAEAAADAWQTGNAQNVIRSGQAYVAALDTFSVDHGLGIFEAGHANLVQDAMESGVFYKPCGAGGGDIGVALATSRAALDRFAGKVRKTDFVQLDIGMDMQGVRVDT
jgi:phosphomevalonate kinase